MRRALNIYQKLSTLEDRTRPLDDLKPLADELHGLRSGGGAIVVAGSIGDIREANGGEFGVWTHQLFRRRFAFNSLAGGHHHLDIRCEFRRAQSPVAPDREWIIPESWGDCSLYVFGAPGTTFELVEYATGPTNSKATP